MSEVPAPPPAAPPKLSGCAIGCFVASLILFVATVAGSLYVLHRMGHIAL